MLHGKSKVFKPDNVFIQINFEMLKFFNEFYKKFIQFTLNPTRIDNIREYVFKSTMLESNISSKRYLFTTKIIP